MSIIVSSMIEIQDVSYKVQKYFQDKLTFMNPEYMKRIKYKMTKWGVFPKIYLYSFDPIKNSLYVPRALLDQVLEQCPDEDVVYKFGKSERTGIRWNLGIKLRDYQQDAFDNIKNKSGVLIAPAGSGKTVMGLKYIHELNQPAIWLTHTIELLQQVEERIKMFMHNYGEVGMIGDSNYRFGDGKILLSTFQSLHHKPELIEKLNKNYNVIIVDEAHHIPAAAFSEVVNKLSMEYKLGLTATPDRRDELEFMLYLSMGKVLHDIPRATLYEDEALIRPVVEFIFTKFEDNFTSKIGDNNSVNAGGEEITFKDITDVLYNDEDRMNMIADNIVKNIGENNYQMVISESIEYAYKIKAKVDELIKNYHGVNTAIVHGRLQQTSWMKVKTRKEATKMIAEKKAVKYKYENGHRVLKINYTDKEYKEKQIHKTKRKKIIDAARAKEIHILFATKLAREGLDIPHLNIGHNISARKGDSTVRRNDGSVLEQEVGRIMRPDPDNPNKQAIWYDYVDYNCGILKKQYYSRRKVYTRLCLKMNSIDKEQHMTKMQKFLHDNDLYI